MVYIDALASWPPSLSWPESLVVEDEGRASEGIRGARSPRFSTPPPSLLVDSL